MTDEAAKISAGAALIASLVGAWALLRGKSKSSAAETQDSLNDSFKLFMDESRDDRKRLEGEITALRGELRQLRQYNQSLIRLLKKKGIPVPLYKDETVIKLPAS